MLGRAVIVASDAVLLAEAVAGCAEGVVAAHHECRPDPADAARLALVDGLALVAPESRAAVPIVLAVSGPCIAAASRFAARCLDESRRLRPSESVRLEVAEVVRAFGVAAGWRGPCYLIATPDLDGRQAVTAAWALRQQHPAVLVGELIVAADESVLAVVATCEGPTVHCEQRWGSVLLGSAALVVQS